MVKAEVIEDKAVPGKHSKRNKAKREKAKADKKRGDAAPVPDDSAACGVSEAETLTGKDVGYSFEDFKAQVGCIRERRVRAGGVAAAAAVLITNLSEQFLEERYGVVPLTEQETAFMDEIADDIIPNQYWVGLGYTRRGPVTSIPTLLDHLSLSSPTGPRDEFLYDICTDHVWFKEELKRIRDDIVVRNKLAANLMRRLWEQYFNRQGGGKPLTEQEIEYIEAIETTIVNDKNPERDWSGIMYEMIGCVQTMLSMRDHLTSNDASVQAIKGCDREYINFFRNFVNQYDFASPYENPWE